MMMMMMMMILMMMMMMMMMMMITVMMIMLILTMVTLLLQQPWVEINVCVAGGHGGLQRGFGAASRSEVCCGIGSYGGADAVAAIALTMRVPRSILVSGA
jgi:uncharacterized membrane protein YgcG